MIFYTQASGEISIGPVIVGTGYSGFGDGVNNPEMEADADVGPIPRGSWKIVAWHDDYEDKGPCVAQLSPVDQDAYGRSGFLIHGDNEAMDRTASHGCIILGPAIREKLRAGGQTQLEVE